MRVVEHPEYGMFAVVRNDGEYLFWGLRSSCEAYCGIFGG